MKDFTNTAYRPWTLGDAIALAEIDGSSVQTHWDWMREENTDDAQDIMNASFEICLDLLAALDPEFYEDVCADIESGRHALPDGTYAQEFSLPSMRRTLLENLGLAE